jgi:hypothetical protein
MWARTATPYSLGGLGIESRWGSDPSGPAMGPTQSPAQWVPRLFPRGKAAGAWRWPPTPSSTEVKESVELYLYSPSGPSWPVLRWTSPSTSILQVYGKLKLKYCNRKTSQFVPVQAMKVCKGCRVISSLIFNLGTRWKWVVNVTSLPLYPGRETRYPLFRRLGASKSRSGRFGEEESMLPLARLDI